MNSVRPLDNFPVIRTLDIEEASEGLARIYVRPTLALPPPDGGFRAVVNECRLQNVRLVYASFGAPFGLEFPAADYFLQILPMRGRGEIVARQAALPLFAGAGATISPDAGYKVRYEADYEAVLLKVDKEALTNKLVAMTGATISEPLRVEPVFDSTRPAAKILQQYLPVLVDTLSAAVAPLPAWWETQTEQLLMTMFLCAHRHNYSHLMEEDDAPDAAPWQIRRVEEYIEAHWQVPITLEDLAEVAGMSAFSLFRSFKKKRGYSPLEFAARVRAKNGATR
jgi:AraC-type DNA-binding domain-containing proteins